MLQGNNSKRKKNKQTPSYIQLVESMHRLRPYNVTNKNNNNNHRVWPYFGQQYVLASNLYGSALYKVNNSQMRHISPNFSGKIFRIKYNWQIIGI